MAVHFVTCPPYRGGFWRGARPTFSAGYVAGLVDEGLAHARENGEVIWCWDDKLQSVCCATRVGVDPDGRGVPCRPIGWREDCFVHDRDGLPSDFADSLPDTDVLVDGWRRDEEEVLGRLRLGSRGVR